MAPTAPPPKYYCSHCADWTLVNPGDRCARCGRSFNTAEATEQGERFGAMARAVRHLPLWSLLRRPLRLLRRHPFLVGLPLLWAWSKLYGALEPRLSTVTPDGTKHWSLLFAPVLMTGVALIGYLAVRLIGAMGHHHVYPSHVQARMRAEAAAAHAQSQAAWAMGNAANVAHSDRGGHPTGPFRVTQGPIYNSATGGFTADRGPWIYDPHHHAQAPSEPLTTTPGSGSGGFSFHQPSSSPTYGSSNSGWDGIHPIAGVPDTYPADDETHGHDHGSQFYD